MSTNPKAMWPQWLRDADTRNAKVEISSLGRVIWRGGDWHGGDWNGGIWHGGDWRDGIWRDGDWRDGVSTPARCRFRVRGAGDIIRVGCKSYTITEARALCDDGELPPEAPPRGSESGRLLRASVLAQIAYQEALQ